MLQDGILGLFISVLIVILWFLQLGGGYLFGLPVGFVADSLGATLGATAAFLLGRTVCLLHKAVFGALILYFFCNGEPEK